MATIDRVREKLRKGEYEFVIPHFFEEMAADDLTFEDIENVILSGRIERRFANDPRGTRYEVVGEALNGRAVGVVYRFKGNGRLLLITTYVVEYEA